MANVPGNAPLAKRPDLGLDLEKRVKRYTSLSRGNYYAAFICNIVAAIASFFAGISAAGELFSKVALGFLSALPGALLLVNTNCRFLMRSSWHSRKAYRIEEQLHQLRYANKPESEVVAAIAVINTEMDIEWDKLIGKSTKS